MIQVCSRCGTRWNVRDRQRVWCPRCHGTLLAPSVTGARPPPRQRPAVGAPAEWDAAGREVNALPREAACRIPLDRRAAGFRAATAARAQAVGSHAALCRPFRVGACRTTSRYVDQPQEAVAQAAGPSVRMVRATIAADDDRVRPRGARSTSSGMHCCSSTAPSCSTRSWRVLPHGWRRRRERAGLVHDDRDGGGADELAGGAPRSGVRTARTAPRHGTKAELYVGCLVPLVNLFAAPVFVIELAMIEARVRELAQGRS